MRFGPGTLFALAATAALAACGSSDKPPRLLNLEAQTRGPDEFSIVPYKPLQEPENFAELPPPTPGGRNRVDATPQADAIAALGGDAAVLAKDSVDGGIVTYASRYGVAPNIRQQLAAEDLAFRKQNDGKLLERVFKIDVYFKAYRPLSLDQFAELNRLRKLGVQTPAVPPDPASLPEEN